jgi:hypothetical protein
MLFPLRRRKEENGWFHLGNAFVGRVLNVIQIIVQVLTTRSGNLKIMILYPSCLWGSFWINLEIQDMDHKGQPKKCFWLTKKECKPTAEWKS